MTLVLAQRRPFLCEPQVKRTKFLFPMTEESGEGFFDYIEDFWLPWITDSVSKLSRKPARRKSWSQRLFMPGYSPEEILVKTQAGSVIVSATHEEGDEDNMDRREFKRKIQLPNDVDDQNVKTSYAEKDGTLTIYAPLKQVAGKGPRESEHFKTDVQSFIDEGTDKVLKVPLPTFSTDDIDVKVRAKAVEIHAKEDDEHGYRETFQRIRLPSDVDVERISSKFTKDGMLEVKVPKVMPVEVNVNEEEEKNEKNVEVTENDE